MFIRYQTVRNSMLGVVGVSLGGIAAFFGLRKAEDPPIVAPPPAAVTKEPAPTSSPPAVAPTITPVTEPPTTELPADRPSDEDRYAAAMKLANARADASRKGKDVLGASSPWKLNLYDDNQDGQWDRGKLDVDRDEIDDEKWSFKNGRWEKDDGRMVWRDGRWVGNTKVVSAPPQPQSDQPLTRYRAAMKIATSRADPSGKGKDVLGASSPWKLNLYDDDRDEQWDRGKLDVDRDDVDDEKWNFNNGRWEKDGGRTVWLDGHWVDNTNVVAAPPQPQSDQQLTRYRAAMKIATSRADPSGKGKDVLGASSPWKLNLYDDDRDGQWDRGKLDVDRDDVDDEKWNLKNGRWEKSGGDKIWNGSDWVPG